METATNPETGETVVLVGNSWQKADQEATNDKGSKAFLVGGKWLTDDAAPATAVSRLEALAGGINRGFAGLAGLPVDTAQNALNLGAAAVHATASPFMDTGVFRPPFQGGPLSSQGIAEGMNKIGLTTDNPNPEDAASRMLHTGGMIASGGGRPQIAPAIVGAIGGEVLGPKGAALGALAPAAASQAVGAARTAMADRVQPRIEAFKQAGSTPSVGQATEFNFIQGFENLLSKFPGGQGVFRKFSEKQQEALGNTAKTGVSAEDAGRAIEKGVSDFMGRTKGTWQTLDAEVAAKIPKGSAFVPAKTVQALDELTAVIPGAEKTTGALVNETVAGIKANIAADMKANNGVMPYEALRAIRTKVGGMIENNLTGTVPNGELKKLYGALTSDMEAAANQAGAGQAFSRQNAYYKARMDRVENTLQRVLGNTPEETFAKFMPKDAEQANKVRQVMRSLDPEQRQVVTDAVVNRLGRAAPGKQNEAGDVFSPETFLTNWNKLSPGAKAQLFSDADLRKNMDALANVTQNMRGGAKVFANPSGSAGAAAPYGIGYLAATGNLATGGTLMGGAYVGAKMLTNPTIVQWLSQYPKVSPEAAANHLARLGVIFNQTKDEGLKQELGKFMESLGQKKDAGYQPPPRGAPAGRVGAGTR